MKDSIDFKIERYLIYYGFLRKKMFSNLNIRAIILICCFSLMTALIYNAFRSEGLPLLRPAKQLQWLKDTSKIQMPDTQNVSPIKPVAAAVKQKEAKTESVPAAPLAINLKQALKLLNSQKAIFIDARDKWDFKEGHISGAVNIPEYSFENTNEELLKISRKKAIVVYCGGDDCEASTRLAGKIFRLGYKQVYVFVGGWKEWSSAGYPKD